MDKKTVEHIETLNGEIARLRGALMNVTLMLNHNYNPNKCAEWIENVLSLDLIKENNNNSEFYSFQPEND